ncbi:MAG: fumarylacetoacetase [Bacteroidia bacterium]|nr:fumarylacetoacetase [Bacteroidia bacterium]
MNLESWIDIPAHSDFSIYNIPFGIYSDVDITYRACTRIGDYVIDLYELSNAGFFDDIDKHLASAFENKYLNDFISKGKHITSLVRKRIQELLLKENNSLQSQKHLHSKVLKPIHEVKILLPLQIGDYTDFYSSEYHATNVGKMFRDPNNALLPNWKHLPVGYHGRSSSIFVSPHSFYRPNGQTKPADADKPVFGPTKLLDFELETAFVVGKSTEQGQIIPVNQAKDYIFGMVLFNDWSARDIQTWEYQPLGPFLAKNFASTISPWIVTLEALEPFFIEPHFEQIPSPLPYLQQKNRKSLDINLEVFIRTQNGTETLICQSNNKYLYWTMEQQLAHHTINGCPVNIGDLMASGTISGPEPHQYGSMLELTWKGTQPIKLSNGEERKFIQDGDTVIIKGYAQKGPIRVGFGECMATVLPAKTLHFN